MFVSMRRYSPKNGAITRASLDLLRRQVHADFVPRIQGISGFRGYYVVNIENREIVTLWIYDTADGLAQCAQRAAEYTLRNPLLYELGQPEITEGEVLTAAAGDGNPVEVA